MVHPIMNGIAVSWTVVFLPNKSMNIPANREPTGVEMTPKLAIQEASSLEMDMILDGFCS